jgi:riboflavin kinase/FMN adenylyltransferase
MRVITENTIRTISKSSVVTIGNFDGVHLGHKALIRRCHELAEPGQEVAVVTFEPLPQAFFVPARAPARLGSQRQKLGLLERSGIDLVWTMSFNQDLAEMTADSFVESVVCRSLAASCVVVGADFRFGRARKGDLAALTALGEQHGFKAEAVADVEFEGTRVSSTAIRETLAGGDFDLAGGFLGRSYTVEGEVIRGSQLGRELGYPTANMRLEAEPSPISGVFAVRVRKPGDQHWRDAVANLGNRPAVGGTEFLVEVHLFDFSSDLYGQRLEVEFVEKIRAEENFDSMDDMVDQIKKDEARARKILRTKTQ